MSGDSPATIENIWKCPFCGKKTIKAEVYNEYSFNPMKYDTERTVEKRIYRCLPLTPFFAFNTL